MKLLAHTRVEPPGTPVSRWIVFLHGILGSRANWRSIARRLAGARPDTGSVLVDLRMHGDSRDLPPPHTVAAAATDVVALRREAGLPLRVAVGHSFGGKVALAYAAAAGDLDELWLIDSMPGARAVGDEPGSPRHVIAALRALPSLFARREDFVALVGAGGLSSGVAEWLAMNLRAEPEGYRLLLDLDAIEQLLDDYARRDDWSVLEHPPAGCRVNVVVAGRSSVWTGPDLDRARRLAAAGILDVHVLPDVGHWIHIEDPDALLALLRRGTR